jgi:hypothetical protein
MSHQLTSHIAVPAVFVRSTADEDLLPVATRSAVTVMRRAATRLQASHVTRAMIRELGAPAPLTAPRTPLFARLDALQQRYAHLGGDPADLVR